MHSYIKAPCISNTRCLLHLRICRAHSKRLRQRKTLWYKMSVIEEIPLDPNDAQNYLGRLPTMKWGQVTLTIPDTVPKDAKNWLIYAFVTVIGPTDQFGRGYYSFSSTDKANSRTYQRFMNVGFFNDSTINSTNFCIPANTTGQIVISLNGVGITPKKRQEDMEKRGLNQLMQDKSGDRIVTGAFVVGYMK